ncbi:YdeI family protein [uncultured Serinicoccus sp.]|uniref:YdeI/OmpD-associated family protein n=1 Tax=uncultured Serinicoccus sp. TaxID=735514 RepID=UPI002613C201|nr:YdeI/OmpD-associated family protein [uncultured Serinicoccus sp.]
MFFDGPEDFRAWLEEHHDSAEELWMGLHKRHVDPQGLTWAQAVPEALCFGWIDSVSQRIDADSRRQRWTPRRRGSIWSAVNVAHVERLLEQGRMRPAGIAAFEARTAERTAVYSFERPPDAFDAAQEAALQADPAAWAFWEAATPSYRRTVTGWVTSAKREATRASRMQQLVEDCAAGRLVPPQRYGATPGWLTRAAAAAERAADGQATDGQATDGQAADGQATDGQAPNRPMSDGQDGQRP